MDAFTPQQTIELVSRIGTKKAHMRLDKLWWNSFMSGPLLGFGCAILMSTGASPWYQENAPGLIRTISAIGFPVGLIMIVLTGADLFTSNVMFMSTALLHRRISVLDLLKNWVVSFFGNLAGSLFFMAIITGYGGIFEENPIYKQAAITLVIAKAQTPHWHQIFLRGIAANWLVCLAVFLSIQARDVASKIIAIWFPTFTFVALAFDHVVANMFIIPQGIWAGAPFGTGYYIWKSMIPTLLGNIVGGGLFVGVAYWYLYLTGEMVSVTFDPSSLPAAMEAGGPMRRTQTEKDRDTSHQNGGTIHGLDPEEQQGQRQLPQSGTQMMSSIGRELSDDSPYAKTHAERVKQGREESLEEKV
ncbi:hypothetical protein LTR03_006757 [Friedmanniomyces endolithicus]|nr:hypothetical protein LTR03_006757 [Friedmanniomyces endolithicus]